MTEISCDICMDLAPLVRDGLASEDSRAAVLAHAAHCDACRALLGDAVPASGTQPPSARLRRRLQGAVLALLVCGILAGLSLTGGEHLFYNTLLMPLLGALGYVLLRGRAYPVIPAALFILHLGANGVLLICGLERLDLPTLLIWTAVYALFAAVGTLIAQLLHFAFRKER